MTPLKRRTRRVVSAEVALHVVEVGEVGRPPLLLIHGFPDSHEVYGPLLDDLGRDFHVATFDLRGVGESSAPRDKAGFRIENVLPDFTAVIDAVFGPSAHVHLLAHDWGSVLSFSYITEPTMQRRVRSFTSVSGPHLGLLWSDNLRNVRSLAKDAVLQGLGQVASSWYAFFFHLPYVPEWLFRRYGAQVHRLAMLRGGVARHDPYLEATVDEVWPRVQHALELYRQNALRPPRVPALGSITTPISLIVPRRDPFIRPQSFAFLHEYATDLSVHDIDASHWAPRSHPGDIARIVRALASRVDGASAFESHGALERDDEDDTNSQDAREQRERAS